MTPKNSSEIRRFLASDAGQDFIAQLQKDRPKINIIGEGIDDSAVIRMAAKSSGWEDCVEKIQEYIKPPKGEVEIGGFRDFEPKKESKK